MKLRTGIIIPNGVSLKPHEYQTVLFLTNQGYDIELIPTSNLPGVHSPDIIMLGEKWEIKSPTGKGRWLIENTLKKAIKQSKNIIIDLRRIQLNQEKSVTEIKKQFSKMKTINKIKIITKSQRIIDFTR